MQNFDGEHDVKHPLGITRSKRYHDIEIGHNELL
jgi:hypothetical protein